MKNFYTYLFILIVGYGCNSSGSQQKVLVEKDSIQYAPEGSGTLSREEFKRDSTKVANFLDSAINEKYFNGGILIAKNGKVLYENYFGYKDIRTKDSLTAETSFQIASISKTFTSAAVLRLVQEGKLNLDTYINQVIPNFPYEGITIKMLLNHRSGLPEYLYFFEKNNWDRKNFATNNDVINALFNWKPPRAGLPDKRFDYTNTNFVLLATIVEKVSGMTFPQYMKKTFFDPLKMDHTYIRTINDSMQSVGSFDGYGKLWQLDFSDGPYGDKNVYSTPRDLLKWDQAMYTDNVISETLKDSAFTAYSHERKTIYNYGLGWRLLLLPNGKKVIYHNGRWHGFNTAFSRLPDEKVTIIILSSKYNRQVYMLARKMFNLFGNYDGKQEEVEE